MIGYMLLDRCYHETPRDLKEIQEYRFLPMTLFRNVLDAAVHTVKC